MRYIKLVLLLPIFQILLVSCAQRNSKNQTSNIETMKEKNNEEWKKTLSPEQYYVLREKGTEKPFSGELLMNKEAGVYKCAACGNELFTDDMKFDSHCGWPSFDKEIAGGKIKQIEDNSHGMHRIEIVCAKCNGHLGHIFDDGPTETGKRYCVNSVSLAFTPSENKNKTEANTTKTTDTAVFGGGCFWCVEAVYERLDGVKTVKSGYAGGETPNPSYKEVCTGTTNHAEVVEIIYDPTKTSYEELLKVFFTVHDPTTLNRQGNDVGTQYRSVVFYTNDEQKIKAENIISELNKSGAYTSTIVTQVQPLDKFYVAEEYHQGYFDQNKKEPYCQMVIQPKVEKFEKVFKDKLKK